MGPKDMLEFVQKRPFQPFRITLTDGRTFDLRHPDMAIIGRTSMVIGIPLPNNKLPIYDRAVTVDLLHIMQAERLETAPNAGGNGASGQPSG